MRKKILLFTMSLLAISSVPFFASCSDDDDNEEQIEVNGSDVYGIHCIEVSYSGDTKNWMAANTYFGIISDSCFINDYNSVTEGKFVIIPVSSLGSSGTGSIAIITGAVKQVVTTATKCNRLAIEFGGGYQYESGEYLGKNSSLTINLKGYVNGKLTNSFTKTFYGNECFAGLFSSTKHPDDRLEIAKDSDL